MPIFVQKFFTTKNLFITLTFDGTIMSTKCKKLKDLGKKPSVTWYDSFNIYYYDGIEDDTLLIQLYYEGDNNMKPLGKYNANVKEWISNGRYEGDVELITASNTFLGDLSLVVRLVIGSGNATSDNSNTSNISNWLFTENDRVRIFQALE